MMRPPGTRLLVSVKNAREALISAEHGADLIDVKDPDQGSLGAATVETWSEVRTAVAGTVPVSAALGELLESECRLRAARALGLKFAKVGLANCRRQPDWPARWSEWRNLLPRETSAVAVIYADWQTCGAPAPEEVLAQLVATHEASVVLCDTFDKRHGSLRELWSSTELRSLANSVKGAGCQLVLAGSLRLGDLAALLPLAPDYVAVRGAVCRGPRTGELDGELVRQWESALSDARTQCQAAR